MGGIPGAFLAGQAESFLILRKKAPALAGVPGLILPPRHNLEQSSSEYTALYKARLFQQLNAKRVIDLTGGGGIDSWTFAGIAKATYVEPNTDLFHRSMQNFKWLGLQVAGYNERAEDFLQREEAHETAWLYADPSRRTGTGKRIAALKEWQPNVVELADRYLHRYAGMLLKLSPMFDHHALLQLFGDRVQQVHTVSVKGELKELLVLLCASAQRTPEWTVADVTEKEGGGSKLYTFTNGQGEQVPVELPIPGSYLIDPDPGIRKLRCESRYAQHMGMMVAPGGGWILSGKLPESALGKIFRVQWVKPFRSAEMKKLRGKRYNVICRSFFLSAPEIEKRYRFVPGDRAFLLFSGDRQTGWIASAERCG